MNGYVALGDRGAHFVGSSDFVLSAILRLGESDWKIVFLYPLLVAGYSDARVPGHLLSISVPAHYNNFLLTIANFASIMASRGQLPLAGAAQLLS